SALLLAGVMTLASAETPQAPRRTVYLDHVALEEMKKSNPERYAQVRSVMATASELCGANAGKLWSAANVTSAGCSGVLLKMSFPPKREIGFQIDDTWYIALVTVKDKPALFNPVPGQLIPVDQLGHDAK